MKSFYQEKDSVSEEMAAVLVQAYKKLYEASGAYYREEDALASSSLEECLLRIAQGMEALASEFDELRLRDQMMKSKLQKLQAECIKHETALKNGQSMDEKGFVELIRSFISFRDHLFLLEETAREQNDPNVRKIAESLMKSSRAAFVNGGIDVLDENGEFDETYQQIVETIETEDMTLDGTVAETFRCGYRLGNSLIRFQEVKTYACQPLIDLENIEI